MLPVNPAYTKDFYKSGHIFQYTPGTEIVYSNLTPRGTRRPNSIGGIIAFGFQYWVLEHLIRNWNENFFQLPRDLVVKQYQRRMDTALGPGMDTSHIGALHELGYLPLYVKAVPEGSFVPYRVPVLTIRNTDKKFFWLTNMLETDLSMSLWKPMTSATTAFIMRRVFDKYAKLTGGDPAFVPWQGHDFSMRGMAGLEDSCLSGAAHLLSFTGTDTIPAIDFLENYYGADAEKELIGGSVPATEHSVMCLQLKDGEYGTFERLITETYPAGIVSVVSDTWDFWKVLTDYLPRLQEVVKRRSGKLVIRPDSGDPVKIICGDPESPAGPVRDGAIRTLYNVFGGTVNRLGFVELDPHIGLIYGDSITPERQVAILEGLRAKGFASTNVVLGVGSYTYEYVTRDTDGWAMKATYAEVNGEGVNIFKDPATDDGLKKSATGLLKVYENRLGAADLMQSVDWNTEQTGLLQPIFADGKAFNLQTLAQIRARINSIL